MDPSVPFVGAISRESFSGSRLEGQRTEADTQRLMSETETPSVGGGLPALPPSHPFQEKKLTTLHLRNEKVVFPTLPVSSFHQSVEATNYSLKTSEFLP